MTTGVGLHTVNTSPSAGPVLAAIGVDEVRLFQKITPAKVSQLCSLSSIPLVVDDPDTNAGFTDLLNSFL